MTIFSTHRQAAGSNKSTTHQARKKGVGLASLRSCREARDGYALVFLVSFLSLNFPKPIEDLFLGIFSDKLNS